MSLPPDVPQVLDIELSLRRVVVGYRVVGAVWLTVLGVITLAGHDDPERPAVVVLTIGFIIGWAALTAWLHVRRPEVLASVGFLLADAAVAVASLLSADFAVSESFSGGYPLSTVFLAIYGRGAVAGLAAAVALAAAAMYRVSVVAGSDLSQDSGAILVYLFAAAAAAWAVNVIRTNDRFRRAAEDAFLTERSQRARIEERAEMAAHLHDSVLQTLALIQREAASPQEVTTLARKQERELRSWLYGADERDTTEAGFKTAVAATAAEVEELHGVRVEVVTVGDAPLDERITALVRAGREALVNAARHSRADSISVYAEADETGVTLFVRDRGRGFDPTAVDPARHGIAESIAARMQRHGGTARISSRPGAGTEVELIMGRASEKGTG